MSARPLLVLLVLLLWLWPGRAAADPGFTDSCEQALPKQQIDDLSAAMREVEVDSPCALVRVNTLMFRTLIEWRHEGETLPILLAPRGCLREPDHEGDDLAYWAAPELEQRCPAAVAGVRAFVGEAREELVPVLRDQVPIAGPSTEPGVAAAPDYAPPLRVAGLAWFVALVAACVGAAQARQQASARAPARTRAGLAMLAVFTLALVVRASVDASIANWYGPFLPAEGLGEQRFGGSSTSLQMLARALTPWSEDVAFGLMRVTGALAIPLVMLVVRRLGGTLAASVVAGILLALAPIAVRMSASSSEHVLAGTLALAAWAAWLRSAYDPRLTPRVLALCLVLLAVLARVDCWPQLAMIPLWTVLVSRDDEQPGEHLSLERRLLDAGAFALVWGMIGVYAYYRVVLPSNHPGPESEGMRYTARVLFSQLWVATSEPPHWISPLSFALVLAGIAAALSRRRFGLLAAALLSWALIFIPLGRNLTHDGLTGARYFVLALPVLMVLAAQLGDLVELLASRHLVDARARVRQPLLGALAVLLVVLGSLAAQPGWTHSYTFQAEYLWLAEQLEDRELEGCTLWFARPRQPTGENDLDCCLAPDRSPLRLVAPELRFRSFPHTREPADDEGCHLYYLGSVCSIEPDLAPRVPEGVARIRAQCERMRARENASLIDGREVTMDNLNDRFRTPPSIELRMRGGP